MLIDSENKKIKVESIEDIITKRRAENEIVLTNKMLDYELSLDKKQLSKKKKLSKNRKNNEFRIEETKEKNNIDYIALKGGNVIARFCVILTFVSCLLTILGNLETFIFNIPVGDLEKFNYFYIWESIKGEDIKLYRLNIITTLIYIPFILSMQVILYQVSLNNYIVKARFKQYYKYVIFLTFAMLFYSIYSNYVGLSRYVMPSNITSKFLVLIPSVLLDVSSILFLSLSQRMKSLDYDKTNQRDVAFSLFERVLKVLGKRKDFKNDSNREGTVVFERSDKDHSLNDDFEEKKEKNSGDIDNTAIASIEVSNENSKDYHVDEKEIVEDSNITAIENNDSTIEKVGNSLFPIIDNKTSNSNNEIGNSNNEVGNSNNNTSNSNNDIGDTTEEVGDNKRLEDIIKNINIDDYIKSDTPKDYKIVLEYILELKRKGIKKVKVDILMRDVGINKNVWQLNRDKMIKDNIVSFSGRITKII